MTLVRLRERLDALQNIGRCYGPFPDEQELPYITYKATQQNPVYADGQIVYASETVILELVTKRRDFRLENVIQCILMDEHVIYEMSMDFDEENGIHTATFTFETED